MDDDKILTSENSPELKALIEKISEEVLEENREAYEELARYDSVPDERYSKNFVLTFRRGVYV